MHSRGMVLIAAGGTGGHVFPALAVADALRARQIDVMWLGTRKGIESRVADENHIPIHYIDVVGIRGKGLRHWIKAPFLMLLAVFHAARLMASVKPSCVLGMGGFVSAAGGVAAFLSRVPLLLQEQNAIAGTTNRLLSPLAKTIFTGFPGVFANLKKTRYSGNPLREAMLQLPTPEQRNVGSRATRRLLVLGGSLGAHAINEVLPATCQRLREFDQRPLEIWHQAGVNDADSTAAAYAGAGLQARVDAFINDMPAAYAWADIVVARAGAITVSELAAVGLAAVLVPYPYAIDDHQSANADWLVATGAAKKILQQELDADRLAAALLEMTASDSKLLQLANHGRMAACPAATQQIADACEVYAND